MSTAMLKEAPHYSRTNLVQLLKSMHRPGEEDLQISVANVHAIGQRDLLDLYLHLCGVKRWQWIDAAGHAAGGHPLGRSLWNLLADAAAWPSIYARTRFDVRKLKRANRDRRLAAGDRILYLKTDHWFGLVAGGSVAHVAGVISGFQRCDWRPFVVSTDPVKGLDSETEIRLCEPVYGRGRNIPEIPELLYNQQIEDTLDRWIQAITPSFIYHRYSLGNYSGLRAAQKYCIPLVCEYNSSFVWMARNWNGRRLIHEDTLEVIETVNLVLADVVVVVSSASRDELVARGVPVQNILLNPNGVDCTIYSPDVSAGDKRQNLGLDGKTVVGFIGTFGKWHGAEVLAEAFGRLLERWPELRKQVALVFIGDGPQRPLARQIIESLGAAANCRWTGMVPQEQGPSFLSICDILVAPTVPNVDGSRFFGSPTKLFEYMAMGKAIVASNLEQIGEILEHGRTAWLVEPGDAEALMLGLKAVVDDRGKQRELGVAARRTAVTQHSWAQHSSAIIDKVKARCG
jgi:glycosyltransferase involved in cell wall biosynthesis